MGDGRVQLILAIVFWYLALGMSNSWSLSFAAPGQTAKLRSISPSQLIVEETPAPDRAEMRQLVPAIHAPFFFQAIPINSADKEMLMAVKGIGPTLAASIISYRQHSGPLKTVEDLTKIPGVGSKRAASLAPFLLFAEVP